jgi:hypothetical protein
LPEVVLLDVGMTAELNPRSRGIMLEVFKVLPVFQSAFLAFPCPNSYCYTLKALQIFK